MSRLANIYVWLYNFRKSSHAFIMIAALFVGLATGLLAVGFILSISSITEFLTGLAASHRMLLLFLPVAGALLVGPIVTYLAPEARGHGIPNVMLAVAINRGVIRPVVVVAKAIGSIITIGTGGSAGREGPIAQIGAGVGSTFSQMLGLNEGRKITLLTAGAAAGISATFNAPISGVIFATEVIMRNAGMREFGAIVVASVSASVVSHFFLGNEPAFHIPQYSMRSELELVFYLILGVICSAVGVAFIRTLHFFENFFEKIRNIPEALKPAVGAAIFGPLLMLMPQLYGGGFPGIVQALEGNICLPLLAALVFGKILGTSLCLGSGSSGGVFAPSLFIGAMTGGAFGRTMEIFFPGLGAGSGAYAIIGMAAVFAASARAPVTAILILFEMTRDYHMILPLMFATVISTLLAEWMCRESIYTSKLMDKGLDLKALESRSIFEMVEVKDDMIPFEKCLKVPPYIPLRDLEQHFNQHGTRQALVIDTQGSLYGIVTINDLYGNPGLLEAGIVADVSRNKFSALRPEDKIDEAAVIFGNENTNCIPVVSYEDPRRCLGIYTRTELANAYSRAFTDRAIKEKYLSRLKFKKASQTEIIEYILKENDAAAGKTVAEAGLPQNCNLVAIYRGKEIVAPRGATELRPGDIILAIAPEEEEFLRSLRGKA